VGYDEGGRLTEIVRRRPFSVVLFDEVEKAHPTVWNVLLQVLDGARLTDSQGRVVDFSNTVVLMTSNLGSGHLGALLRGDQGDVAEIDDPTRQLVEHELRSYFRPELLNRLDGVTYFAPLGLETLTAVARIESDRIARRLESRRITLSMTDEALAATASASRQPEYGARPISRFLETHLTSALSIALLDGTLQDGAHVTVRPGPAAAMAAGRRWEPRSEEEKRIPFYEFDIAREQGPVVSNELQ
jgi:ATP-dependent Clp protease ATP-binding subunit ClpB